MKKRNPRFVLPPDNWPLVDPKDDGIRPAGRPDECFYCRQRVGKSHGSECVMVTKVIELAVRAELNDGKVVTGVWRLNEPHCETPKSIEFRYNESSWCAGNFLMARDPTADFGAVMWDSSDVDPWDELTKLYGDDDCLCNRLRFKYLRVVDDTPRGKIRSAEQEAFEEEMAARDKRERLN